MLPEFLDQQSESKSTIRPPVSLEDLQSLRCWLDKKERESSRQVRPAWIEVAWALVVLAEQQVEQSQISVSKPEQFAFETHIVARQVAKQRRERNLRSRFVTDEIKRISSHQLDFLAEAGRGDTLAVMGWYRFSKRRGLGLAMMTREDALDMCRDETSPAQREATGRKSAHDQGKRRLQPVVFALAALNFLLGNLAATVYYTLIRETPQPIDTLQTILRSNTMRCGVDGSLLHFSLRNDAEQTWWGLDVELCKALGAALNVKVEFVKVSASQFENRIKALLDQDVDILFRNTSHTLTRDLNNAIVFGPNYFYEQEYFLDLSASGMGTAVAVDGIKEKNVCVKPGTSNEVTLQQIKLNTDFNIITRTHGGEVLSNNITLLRALRSDDAICDFVFGNYYVLKQLLLDKKRRSPDKKYMLRPLKQVTFDPLAPVLLRDYQWQSVVSYSIYALLYADKLNINSYNVDDKYASGSAIEQNFLRATDMHNLHLTKDWVYRIISKVGNYSEIYYRSIECGYVACKRPAEEEFYNIMENIDQSRWPNKLFRANDPRPGLLQIPRF